MKVREKQSRGGYIDRCVDETIVFELSGWTQTLPSHSLRLLSCVFVFVLLSSEMNGELSFSFSCFLSLRSTHCSQWCVYFLPAHLSPTAIHACTHTELTFWPCNIGAVQIMIACIICGWQMCRPHQDDSLLTALINAGELSNQIEEIIEITHLHFTPYVFHKWYRFKREG